MIKTVIDTNVFISGIFWSGPPAKILHAWKLKKIIVVVTPAIIQEYQRVTEILTKKYKAPDLTAFMDLLKIHTEIHSNVDFPQPICRDPDDDKFISAALSGEAKVIVTGDDDLLSLKNFADIKIMRPREFCEHYKVK